MKFYDIKTLLAYGCQYSICIGERSNGKSYSSLKVVLENYVKEKKQGAYIRRWREDFTGRRASTLFSGHVSNGIIAKLTNGEWTDVYYYGMRWYLCRFDNDKRITDETPFCYGFALSSMEHDKSTSYPDITTIIFDEFCTRGAYLPDEFVILMNVLSTIIRHRTDVKIILLANTVNQYCPLFGEFGLKHIREMEQGKVDVYTYGDSGLKVAVEYCKPNKTGKPSDVYFAFDNPKLSMITGGQWELDIYPHAPMKWRPKENIFEFFILWNEQILQNDIVFSDGALFVFVHLKTTEIKNPDTDLIFTPEHNPKPNYHRNILKPSDKITQKIHQLITSDNVFYQSNEVGEIMRNYLIWCRTN